jgi:hypothetical protein
LLAIPNTPVATPGAPPEQPQTAHDATAIERDATTDMLVAQLRATLTNMR